jgi:steroid 5-alpha reductase family enzyme
VSVEAAAFALGGLVLFMSGVWLASVARRDASIVDVAWGPAFLVAAWACFLSAEVATPRQWLVLTLVHVWGLRLALHLWRRNRGSPEDRRYRRMRENGGERFWWTSLFKVFWLQAAVAWIVSAPLGIALSAGPTAVLGWLDGLGIVLVAVGLLFEAGGDRQLARFRRDPANRGRVCDSGLWRYTRHPNYFGDAVVWWGFFAFAAAVPGGWWSAVGPLLMTVLLVRVTGAAMLEPDLVRTKPDYSAYVARTSRFVPWPPRGG